MVMPRAFSSGAASISSYFFASPPNLVASTVAIAAVSVVLPWSTWPIVPTFTCGFVRSNFCFPIGCAPRPVAGGDSASCLCHDLLGHGLRQRVVAGELHRIRGATLRDGPHPRGVS